MFFILSIPCLALLYMIPNHPQQAWAQPTWAQRSELREGQESSDTARSRLALSLLLLHGFPGKETQEHNEHSWALRPNAGVCLCFLREVRYYCLLHALVFPSVNWGE